MTTTKYLRKSSVYTRVGFFLCVLPYILLALLAVILLSSCSPTAIPQPTVTPIIQRVNVSVVIPQNSPAISYNYVGGGDCSANNATGDLYVNHPDSYCEVFTGNTPAPTPLAVLTEIEKHIRERITATVTAVVTATNTPPTTSTETATATATAKPTDTPTGTPTSVVTATSTPTNPPTGTPSPSATPKVTKTPKATKTPKPTKECNNKNDDKKPDENPSDCNAGGGNG